MNEDHSATASILTETFSDDFSDEGVFKEELENFNYKRQLNKIDWMFCALSHKLLFH